ncbi:hypothetical protein [Mariprofundus sp. KV]|uniref:hypothetical protein n=1 Tax=Mariprofundus sp. KV TaxID=2608715 RepID=UPI0015A0085E|nr:hypothetical protein [Mariprofundus sp. KV]NWF35643.1 hypothetical protein [Mariprofundus sp. KV]
MKLTVALGLQYDSSRPHAHAVMPLEDERGVVIPVSKDTVIDLQAASQPAQGFEFSYRHNIFFLTYNLQGLPAPIAENRSSLDMFA